MQYSVWPAGGYNILQKTNEESLNTRAREEQEFLSKNQDVFDNRSTFFFASSVIDQISLPWLTR